MNARSAVVREVDVNSGVRFVPILQHAFENRVFKAPKPAFSVAECKVFDQVRVAKRGVPCGSFLPVGGPGVGRKSVGETLSRGIGTDLAQARI